MATACMLSAVLFMAVALVMLAAAHYEARLDNRYLRSRIAKLAEAQGGVSPLAGLMREPELPFTYDHDGAFTDVRRYNKD